jgi:hypothetical protein
VGAGLGGYVTVGCGGKVGVADGPSFRDVGGIEITLELASSTGAGRQEAKSSKGATITNIISLLIVGSDSHDLTSCRRFPTMIASEASLSMRFSSSMIAGTDCVAQVGTVDLKLLARLINQ